MDKRSSPRITRAVRAQIDPVNSHAQKTQKSAVIEPQPQENLRHHQVMVIKYAIDLPGLAATYGANPRSVRNAFYLRPQDFPPAIYLPGCRGPRFLVSDVLVWLESRKTQPAPPPPPVTPKPHKGRPRKASPAQIARARQGHGQQSSLEVDGIIWGDGSGPRGIYVPLQGCYSLIQIGQVERAYRAAHAAPPC
jgi:hypothetical protein